MNRNILKNAPFLRDRATGNRLYGEIGIALCPLLVWAVIVYGVRALLLLCVGGLSAAAVRFLWSLISKQPVHRELMGAFVTGLITVFCLSVAAPFYRAVLWGAVASALRILAQKKHAVALSPVCVPIVLDGLLFDTPIPKAFAHLPVSGLTDAVLQPALGTTPLETLAQKELPDGSLLDMFLGNRAGTLGELSAILILLGFLYLVFRKAVQWKGTVQFLIGAGLTAFLFPLTLDNLRCMGCELFSGALVFGAVYLANDFDACPKTENARMVFFLGGGILSILFRYAFDGMDGVFLALLLMGILSTFLDKYLQPRMFGQRKKGKAKETDTVLEESSPSAEASSEFPEEADSVNKEPEASGMTPKSTEGPKE